MPSSNSFRCGLVLSLAYVLSFVSTPSFGADSGDPLPSWMESASKNSIVAFVELVTRKSSPNHIPVAERIAVFDNDGTLWPEQPMYIQLAFALDRIHALAPQHPEWRNTEPFKSALAGDASGVAATGMKGVLELIMATHAGNTTEEFENIVKDWLATAKHPKFNKPYTDLTYQPMQEVLAYLRANDFKTYIVFGGGIEFMRPWAEEVYGIPPEQVIGSSIKLKYEVHYGKPAIVRLPEMDFVDDGEGKPVGIQKFIGRRPVVAFGNSDGDLQMLQWTTAGNGPRLGMIGHHTDANREFAYDRESHFGRLGLALDQAEAKGWVVVNMKKDWKVIYPHELKA